MKKKVKGKCLNCSEEYTRTRYWQRFCSTKCRVEHWDKENPRQYKGDVEVEVEIEDEDKS